MTLAVVHKPAKADASGLILIHAIAPIWVGFLDEVKAVSTPDLAKSISHNSLQHQQKPTAILAIGFVSFFSAVPLFDLHRRTHPKPGD